MEDVDRLTRCIGCGALVPTIDAEPTYHKGASPGCWVKYLEFLVYESERYGYPPVHRVTTDCYSVQHPYRHPKAIRSLNVHLISLCCIVERKYPPARATQVMAGITKGFKERFEWLDPPAAMDEITIADIASTRSLDEYTSRTYEWAEYLWSTWAAHHATIQELVNLLERTRRRSR